MIVGLCCSDEIGLAGSYLVENLLSIMQGFVVQQAQGQTSVVSHFAPDLHEAPLQPALVVI